MEEQAIQNDILIFSKAKCIAEHNSKKVPAFTSWLKLTMTSHQEKITFSVFVSTITYLGSRLWSKELQLNLNTSKHFLYLLPAQVCNRWISTSWASTREHLTCENTQWINNQWGGLVIKNSPANERDGARSLVWEDPTCLWVWALEPRNCNYWAHTLWPPKPARPRARVSIKRSHRVRSSCPTQE